MPTIVVQGERKEYAKGITFEEIAKEYQIRFTNRIGLVIFNGKIRELFKKVETDGVLSFITMDDSIGHKTYGRTAIMMLIKAVHDVDPKLRTKVEFTIGYGYYCTIRVDGKEKKNISDDFVKKVQERMEEMRKQELPITKKTYPIDDAIEIFNKQGMADKVNLFKYRRASEINVYRMDGFCDYFYGYMLPNTSYVEFFKVQKYHTGVLLLLPPQSSPNEIRTFAPREKVFEQMILSSNWGHMMGIDNVGDLNNAICSGKLSDLILVQEALQERRIGKIAENIFSSSNVKFVMIAGPSSSGKTSFSHRLSIQLRTHGMVPHQISLDNYFKNREETPRDEDGNYDFECLEAMDIEQFNQDMTKLLNGEEVDLPVFNFISGKREYPGKPIKLGEEDILVIEGIHGLNEKMSYALPKESKYKIYVSSLTTLNVDAHNRISTTDARLIRRMVRDARTRGASGKRTISMWPSVRRGEERNIFPFQESADEMFNSAQIYELAVLKNQAEPLLFSITKDDPEYYEAKRLLKFLDYFIGIDSTELPHNSIVREFVGGSCFNV
ncbi:MAG: nucleoside kinase [Butyrivibrio sp.]|uniref:nucleoside kinase n=1 Tax=Butyrivibrio sp. TaxID=28121 RepID=UPI0025F47695|nr:nucleoside kinase [Butyrivibrio sp.]MCR5772491.1 nucleoside kinase [Butyrivibrio sp.]